MQQLCCITSLLHNRKITILQVANMVKEIVGAIPRNENFYDREDLIKDMWNIADEHDIFLIGPRRFGKSGILCRMYDKPEKGFKVIFMDCENKRLCKFYFNNTYKNNR